MSVYLEIYEKLMDAYGPQGWWPVGDDPVYSYHKNDYLSPRSDSERFEICIGAILTQNTAWSNVRTALSGMRKSGLLQAASLLETPEEQLKDAIRCAGYYNQKAIRIRNFAEFFKDLQDAVPDRNTLLALNGIGPETADCIRLYAYGQPDFVVDAYTRRFLEVLNLSGPKDPYQKIKDDFEGNLPRDVPLFQEYHALFVAHGKRFYSRKPWGVEDDLFRKFV